MSQLYLQHISAITAFAAAALWFASACVKLPKLIEYVDHGSTADAMPKKTDDVDRLLIGLRRQSVLSACAAFAASIAAFSLGIILWVAL